MAATRNRESRDITVAFVYYAPVCDVAIPPLLGKCAPVKTPCTPVMKVFPFIYLQEFEEGDELYARHGYTLLFVLSRNFF